MLHPNMSEFALSSIRTIKAGKRRFCLPTSIRAAIQKRFYLYDSSLDPRRTQRVIKAEQTDVESAATLRRRTRCA